MCNSYGDGRMREEGNDKVGSGTGVLGTQGYDSDDARPAPGAQQHRRSLRSWTPKHSGAS